MRSSSRLTSRARRPPGEAARRGDPVTPPSGRRVVARRALGTAVDQGLSSLSNAAAVVVVAGALDAERFGWFAIGMTVALLVSNLTRPVTGTLLLLVGSRLEGPAARAASRDCTGAALALGSGLGAVAVAVALVAPLPPVGRDVVLAAGLALPALSLQDCLRYVCFRDGLPWRAVVSDGTWLLALALALPLLRAGGVSSPAAYLATWAAGAAVAAGVALVQHGWSPAVRSGVAWSWSNRHVARHVLVEQTAAQGAAQVAVLVVGAVAGVAASGGFRGAQTLLGPLLVLQMAAVSFVVPELVRRPGLGRRQRIGVALAVSVPLASADLVYGALISTLPRPLGEILLGDAWAATSETVFPVAAWAAAIALAMGPLCVLQAMGRADVTARISVVLAPLLIGGALAGSSLGGAVGAAWGLTAANALVLALWWPVLVARSAHHGPRTPDGGSAVGHDRHLGGTGREEAP